MWGTAGWLSVLWRPSGQLGSASHEERPDGSARHLVVTIRAARHRVGNGEEAQLGVTWPAAWRLGSGMIRWYRCNSTGLKLHLNLQWKKPCQNTPHLSKLLKHQSRISLPPFSLHHTTTLSPSSLSFPATSCVGSSLANQLSLHLLTRRHNEICVK